MQVTCCLGALKLYFVVDVIRHEEWCCWVSKNYVTGQHHCLWIVTDADMQYTLDCFRGAHIWWPLPESAQ